MYIITYNKTLIKYVIIKGRTSMEPSNLDALVSQLTLEEEAGLCSGLNNADTKPVARLGIPSVKMHDGPNGLRREDESVPADAAGYTSIPATCYPGGCALAASWDEDLMDRLGRLLSEECQAEKLPILLGPAINIKRMPICGRNFEYLSEDPFLAGKLAAAYIRAVQAGGIGTGVKHFAVNNQEKRRMSVNAVVDERTLREIYLAGFEIAIREGNPWTVMCAYNRLNGTYCSENPWLLSDVLRGEWGYEGCVMSDWNAVHDRVAGLEAGLDLEMPYKNEANDQKIAQAVRDGRLKKETLDRAVKRMLGVTFRCDENRETAAPYDHAAHHGKARGLAAECMVLLKNNDGLLPLAKGADVAVLGAFAQTPRYQGGGAAHVRPTTVDCPLSEIRAYAPKATYAPGYRLDDAEPDEALIAEAVALAKNSRYAVVFAGLTDGMESEAADRPDMRMPASHVRLIEAVAAVNPRTAVVLMIGSPVEMDWVTQVPAVLNAYLGRQAAGGAIADLLFGAANPCGKLPESFPLRLEHTPAYLSYADRDLAEYREGVFVGYRYYDTRALPVRFPFGHGLSYTAFAYSDIAVDRNRIAEGETLTVSFTVQNCGTVTGKEVAQLYVSDGHAHIERPEKELKAFGKVELKPGESRRMHFTLDRRAFAYYDTRLKDWHVEEGTFTLLVGASSRDIRLDARVYVQVPDPRLPEVTPYTVVADIFRSPERKAALLETLERWAPEAYDLYRNPRASECASVEAIQEIFLNSPLHTLKLNVSGERELEIMEDMIRRMNTLK